MIALAGSRAATGGTSTSPAPRRWRVLVLARVERRWDPVAVVTPGPETALAPLPGRFVVPDITLAELASSAGRPADEAPALEPAIPHTLQ